MWRISVLGFYIYEENKMNICLFCPVACVSPHHVLKMMSKAPNVFVLKKTNHSNNFFCVFSLGGKCSRCWWMCIVLLNWPPYFHGYGMTCQVCFALSCSRVWCMLEIYWYLVSSLSLRHVVSKYCLFYQYTTDAHQTNLVNSLYYMGFLKSF